MQSDMYPLCPYHAAWNPDSPLGTRAGGASPGPTLLAQVAARDSPAGMSAKSSTSTANALRTRPTACLTSGGEERYVKVARRCLAELAPAVIHEPRGERALPDTVKALCHRRPKQRGMRNREQVLGNEPHILLRCHPLESIEPGEVHRARERPQCPIPTKVEVHVEIADRELAQRAMDGLTVSASGVIRLRDGAPVACDLEQRDDVIA